MGSLPGTLPPSNDDLIIVAIRYLEKEYQETVRCIEATALPVIYVDRKPAGIGSLSEAVNRGFKAVDKKYKKVWFVTNVTFPVWAADSLASVLDSGYSAVHPSFDSDHPHICQREGDGIRRAPFIEFTAPMFRTEVFANLMLDERMPYWGMDLDISYRMHAAGLRMAIDHRFALGHTYIRHTKPKPTTTLLRQLRRKETDAGTRLALKKKFKEEWDFIDWGDHFPITALYDTVAKKILPKLPQ